MKSSIGKMYDADTKSIIECPIVFNERTGYWLREDTFDRAMIRDCKKNYNDLERLAGSVVLDLGANCGGFSKMALDAGAKQVVSLEPCPYNFQVLKMNAPGAVVLNAAVSENSTGTVKFYYSDSKRSSSSSSTVERRNASGIFIEVPSYDIMELLLIYRPDVIKMDIESKEYDILDRMESVPSHVIEFALEVHRFSAKYNAYIDRFFPEELWERHSKGFKFFGNMRHNDWIFRRKL